MKLEHPPPADKLRAQLTSGLQMADLFFMRVKHSPPAVELLTQALSGPKMIDFLTGVGISWSRIDFFEYFKLKIDQVAGYVASA